MRIMIGLLVVRFGQGQSLQSLLYRSRFNYLWWLRFKGKKQRESGFIALCTETTVVHAKTLLHNVMLRSD